MNEESLSKPLSNQVAIVTGGSRGIGRSICVALAADGAHVVVNYRSGKDAAQETVRLCEEVGGVAEACEFDVASSEAVDTAIAGVKERLGRIDILVNNAGRTSDGLFVRLKDEDWHSTLGINLGGSFFTARAVAKLMMKARHGRIINISSVVGEMGNAGQAAYVSSKAGLIGLTKALAKELAPRGITVNAVAPGFIETDMTAALDEKQQEGYLSVIPLGRYGKPEEIAKTVAFLSGPNSGYITGQVIGVNGGMYM